MITRHFKRLIKALLHRAGYTISRIHPDSRIILYENRTRCRITNVLEKSLYWEHVHDCIRRLKIEQVCDVGANDGEYANTLRAIGFKGPIFLFEPNPILADKLRERARKNDGWFVYEYGLGDADEIRNLNIPLGTEFASFFTPTPYAITTFNRELANPRTLPIQVVRLDTLMKTEHPLARSNRIFLKIDTQGNDLNVIRGAVDCLNKIPLLQCEITLEPLYDQFLTLTQAIDELARYGYRPVGIYPVCRDPDMDFLIEIDALFARCV